MTMLLNVIFLDTRLMICSYFFYLHIKVIKHDKNSFLLNIPGNHDKLGVCSNHENVKLDCITYTEQKSNKNLIFFDVRKEKLIYFLIYCTLPYPDILIRTFYVILQFIEIPKQIQTSIKWNQQEATTYQRNFLYLWLIYCIES